MMRHSTRALGIRIYGRPVTEGRIVCQYFNAVETVKQPSSAQHSETMGRTWIRHIDQWII